VVLGCKTTDAGEDALAERVVERHPDDVPCVERFEETTGVAPFAEWRADTVGRE
jgi:periplasmic divalent cation tolerance protein